jgi:hypothetical protein
MQNLIKVIEKINRNTDGTIFSYSYHAPTHWCSEGFCKVYTDNLGGRLSWSSGGTNGEFNDIIIADAMRQGFELAQNRLVQLNKK